MTVNIFGPHERETTRSKKFLHVYKLAPFKNICSHS